ncbi:glycoside hydrolase family 5 protein [Iamia sp.]|uniref:glycoside hydrolase family 5 protein n=1 Tax=Iamia sp. TaxID=2722710 RepID=UPI002C092460|nr:cellulase family glycosylhydrolase [Iamia sp.]HXH57890.1 cellulase family glycosylhydrolase [Iamia sp.]
MRRRVLGAVCIALLLLGACSGSGADDDGPAGPSTAGPDGPSEQVTVDGDEVTAPADALPALGRLRVARTGGRALVVDDEGREVLLRGANLSSLGDYHQADPAFAPTRPPTDADWDQMAANGFNVVRLIVSWSALEPQRGRIDPHYVARIEQAVAAAAERRIYTVIDMHQDAWGRFVASPSDGQCDQGTEPAIGWDGAPLWATLTDGADTCRPLGSREGAPAVKAAFTSFYENRDGIGDAFAATWGRLAAAFADDPAVAGFDLFNEPNLVFDAPASEWLYTDLMGSVLSRVRGGETRAGGFPHIVFIEPIVGFPLPGTMPSNGFTTDDQIAFAPHIYAEVIGPEILTVEQTFDVSAQTAQDRGWPLWVGEYGVFSTDDEALDVLRRIAAAQDEHLAGGAQWQWRQWCGDPHSIGVPGRRPTEDQIQLNDVACPADVDAGPNVPLLRVAGRAYPRAAPGRLTELRSDPESGELRLTGALDDDLARRSEMVLWVPGEDEPEVTGEGIDEITLTRTTGGWYATLGVVDSPYEVEVR